MRTNRKHIAFSNGTEFMWWTGLNCDRCWKASHPARLPDGTRYMTKTRCEIENEISFAAATDGKVSHRVHEIVRCNHCKFFQAKRPIYPKRDRIQENEPSLFDSIADDLL